MIGWLWRKYVRRPRLLEEGYTPKVIDYYGEFYWEKAATSYLFDDVVTLYCLYSPKRGLCEWLQKRERACGFSHTETVYRVGTGLDHNLSDEMTLAEFIHSLEDRVDMVNKVLWQVQGDGVHS